MLKNHSKLSKIIQNFKESLKMLKYHPKCSKMIQNAKESLKMHNPSFKLARIARKALSKYCKRSSMLH